MKRVLCLMLIMSMLLLSFVVSGCGEKSGETGGETSTVKPEEVYDLKMTVYVPRGFGGEGVWSIFENIVKYVQDSSGGRLNITLFGADELLSPLESWDGVAAGVSDIDWTSGSYWTGKTPMAYYAQGLPYICDDVTEAWTLLRYFGVEDIIREAYAEHNLHYLLSIPGQSHSLTSKNPITTVQGLKGVKVRASGIVAEILSKAGAATVLLQMSEVYSGLETGLVDAAVMGGIQAIQIYALNETTNYYLKPDILPCSQECIVMNLDTWNNLPDDLQKCIYNAFKTFFLDRTGTTTTAEVQYIKDMQEETGYELIWMDEQEVTKMREIAMSVYEEKAKGDPYFEKALEKTKEFLKALGKSY